MTTAFVLSGGGSLGAVQVGMLQALADRDITPDLLVGTSAGALNASYLAGRGTGREALRGLAASWTATRRRHVFPIEPAHQLMAVTGARPSLFTDRGLRRLVTQHLDYARLQDAAVPVFLVASDLLSGQEVVMSRGEAVSAVLASTALPGILPTVHREGLALVDGGLADNTAISVAVAQGADTVYVLPAGYSCALTEAPNTVLTTALQSLGLLIQQRLITDVAYFADRVALKVLPPLCPVSVSPSDFGQARVLIERAYASSTRWIDNGGLDCPDPEQFMSLHSHGPHGRATDAPRTPRRPVRGGARRGARSR